MMFEAEKIFLFVVATLAINLSPGPSIFYATSVALSGGARAALISVSGMSVGVFMHVLAAASGVAALLATSALAFTVVKYLGAAYLLYLGLKTWMQPTGVTDKVKLHSSKAARAYFYKGVFVDLLNPKVGLFFLAFLPQFINAEGGSAFLQTLVLGTIFIILGWIVTSSIAIIAAKGATVVRGPAKEWIERWIPGGVLIGLGVRLASEEL